MVVCFGYQLSNMLSSHPAVKVPYEDGTVLCTYTCEYTDSGLTFHCYRSFDLLYTAY